MAESTGKRQFTSLLDNATLSRVERMRLQPGRRLTNRSRGEHLAGKGGTSTDLADYRNYVDGDDVRFVDWNIFSRLNRPYVKLYQHEEEMHVVLLVDASSSMQFDNKFELAKRLAAAFGVMGLMNVERVSVYACGAKDRDPVTFTPTTGRTAMGRLFSFLERCEWGGDCPIDYGVEAVLKRHRGRGIAIVLSDFLTFGDLQRPFNLMFSSGLEVWAVQVLSPVELDPELSGDLRFVDVESDQTVDVSNVGDLIGIYHEHREALTENVATLARQRAGRFMLVHSEESPKDLLFDQFRRKGWMR